MGELCALARNRPVGELALLGLPLNLPMSNRRPHKEDHRAAISSGHPLFEDLSDSAGQRVDATGEIYNLLVQHHFLVRSVARASTQPKDSAAVRALAALLHERSSGSVRSSFDQASHEILALPGAPRLLHHLLEMGPFISSIEPAELLPANHTLCQWRSGLGEAGETGVSVAPRPSGAWWGMRAEWSRSNPPLLLRCVLVRNPPRTHRQWACGLWNDRAPNPATVARLAPDVVLHDGTHTHTGAPAVAEVLRACAGRANVLAITRTVHVDQTTTCLHIIGTRLLPYRVTEAALAGACGGGWKGPCTGEDPAGGGGGAGAHSCGGANGGAGICGASLCGNSVAESTVNRTAQFDVPTSAPSAAFSSSSRHVEGESGAARLDSSSAVEQRAVQALRVMLRASPAGGGEATPMQLLREIVLWGKGSAGADRKVVEIRRTYLHLPADALPGGAHSLLPAGETVPMDLEQALALCGPSAVLLGVRSGAAGDGLLSTDSGAPLDAAAGDEAAQSALAVRAPHNALAVGLDAPDLRGISDEDPPPPWALRPGVELWARKLAVPTAEQRDAWVETELARRLTARAEQGMRTPRRQAAGILSDGEVPGESRAELLHPSRTEARRRAREDARVLAAEAKATAGARAAEADASAAARTAREREAARMRTEEAKQVRERAAAAASAAAAAAAAKRADLAAASAAAAAAERAAELSKRARGVLYHPTWLLGEGDGMVRLTQGKHRGEWLDTVEAHARLIELQADGGAGSRGELRKWLDPEVTAQVHLGSMPASAAHDEASKAEALASFGGGCDAVLAGLDASELKRARRAVSGVHPATVLEDGLTSILMRVGTGASAERVEDVVRWTEGGLVGAWWRVRQPQVCHREWLQAVGTGGVARLAPLLSSDVQFIVTGEGGSGDGAMRAQGREAVLAALAARSTRMKGGMQLIGRTRHVGGSEAGGAAAGGAPIVSPGHDCERGVFELGKAGTRCGLDDSQIHAWLVEVPAADGAIFAPSGGRRGRAAAQPTRHLLTQTVVVGRWRVPGSKWYSEGRVSLRETLGWRQIVNAADGHVSRTVARVLWELLPADHHQAVQVWARLADRLRREKQAVGEKTASAAAAAKESQAAMAGGWCDKPAPLLPRSRQRLIATGR